ncbi:MAG: preprotein translocase subunit YajC [Deltaproteobacteria bacterium]|nr:preprotein translocase subunit YajC [Deltaproteobacteria bacterium]
MNALALAIVLQAEGATPGAPSPFGFLMPMVLIFGIFYLLLIRPQQKRQREHEQMLKAVGRGDRVVTTGGIHGTVVGESDEVLTVEVGMAGKERVRLKVERRGIERVLEKSKGGEGE